MQSLQLQCAESTRKHKLQKKSSRGEPHNRPRTDLGRERLPSRREFETFNFEVEGLRYRVRFAYGRIGEIFIGDHKVGSYSDANATDAAVAASLALQHGCPLDVLRRAFLRDMRNRAAAPLGIALDMVAERGGFTANPGQCHDSACRAPPNARSVDEVQEWRARTATGGSVANLQALIASGYRAGVINIDPLWPLTPYGELTPLAYGRPDFPTYLGRAAV